MKKMIALVLAAVMTMSMTTAAFADQTVTNNTGTVDVTYTIADSDESYIVTIPADVNLSSAAISKTGDVKVTNAVLKSGNTLKISVATANGFNLVNGVSAIPYTVSDGAAAIANDGTVLTVAAGTASSTKTLTFATTADNVKQATLTGAHKDTLTFTVSVTQ